MMELGRSYDVKLGPNCGPSFCASHSPFVWKEVLKCGGYFFVIDRACSMETGEAL